MPASSAPQRWHFSGAGLPDHPLPMNLGAADVSLLLAWRTASPPKPIPARDRIKRPVLQLVWKQVEFHMAVAEEHVESASALVIVPDAPFVDVASIRVPGPVTLDDFVRWSERDLGGLDRSAFVRTARRVGITGHMPHSKRVVLPLDEIAVAVAVVAIPGVGWSQKVPFIGGTMPQFVHLCVAIKRTIRGRHKNVVGTVRAAGGGPIALDGIKLGVVLGVHVVGEADLLFVIQAARLLGLRAR